MENPAVPNIADLLQQIDCNHLISRFEGKCIYRD